MPGTKITIESILPHKMRLPEYREEGCGDWFVDPKNGDIRIQVASKTDAWDDPSLFLLALHELTEARLCFASGVVQGAVDAFDALFEKERTEGLHGPDAEPGDDPRAPYRRAHRQACMIEHLAALFLGKFDHGEVR